MEKVKLAKMVRHSLKIFPLFKMRYKLWLRDKYFRKDRSKRTFRKTFNADIFSN